MLFDFVLDETFIGQTIGPPSGFLVNLRRTQAGPPERPAWSNAKGIWTAGRFVLKATLDHHDLCCIDVGSGGGWASHSLGFDTVWSGASVGFRGLLKVVAVPRGSIWELTLSDQPYVRVPESLADYIARMRRAA